MLVKLATRAIHQKKKKNNGEPNTNKKKRKAKKWEKRKWTKKARKLATKDANDLFNRFDHEHMYV